VVVGGELAAGVFGVPVVEDGGGEGGQSWGDAADEAGECAAGVAFERELVCEGRQ
jgi:hypothetical protein